VRVYLDHNATSPLKASVKAAMTTAMEACGNPSSVHGEGRAARKIVDDARENLAFALGCRPQMLAFTSGGTEANNWAIRGLGAERILVSAIEHPSVLEAAKMSGKKVETIPVDAQGIIDLPALEAMLVRQPNTLVSVMLANNETGVIQPLDMVAAMVRGAGALLHVDAVQAFGKMQVNFGLTGCDVMTIAAHKVGGPQGIGALVLRDGLAIDPMLHGGGQESRRRAGTENVLAIAGFGVLAAENMLDVKELRDQLESSLEDVVVFGQGSERLSNTSCFAAPGSSAETLLINLDLAGIAVSSGSACSSGKVARSHVLAAMGIAPDLAKGALRISLGWNTTAHNIQTFISTWQRLMARHKAKAA
jgi:cysteine desulfurase